MTNISGRRFALTKEVLLTLRGLQFDQREENADKIEIVTVGDYYKKNDKHYVIYEEVTEGFERPTKNRLKIGSQMVELTRNGLVNVHMVFQENKKNMSNYNTPFGQILVGIDTKRISSMSFCRTAISGSRFALKKKTAASRFLRKTADLLRITSQALHLLFPVLFLPFA